MRMPLCSSVQGKAGEKALQRRSQSRIPFNVPLRVRLREFAPCGLADELFDHSPVKL